MSYVLVLFTDGPCETYPDTKCVMEVIGPFDDRRSAEAAYERQPEWTSPHIMILTASE